LSDTINTAGYFGKLPCFNDFVKYNAGSEELLILDKWLQDGLLKAKMKLKSDWVNYYKNAGEFFFFYPFTGTSRALSGLIIFNHDKSGREFPFIIFFYLDKQQFKSVPFYLIPMILFDILIELKSTVSDYSSINNLSILNERLNKITYSLNSAAQNNIYQKYLSSTLQTDFWDRITGSSDELAGLRFLTRLYQHRENNEPAAITFLSAEDHYINDLTFLIHLAFAYQKIPDFLPAFFWTHSENTKHLAYVYNNKPLQNNFIDLITGPDMNQDDSSDSLGSINNSYENILSRDITLKEFLNAIH